MARGTRPTCCCTPTAPRRYRPKVDAGQHGFGPAYRLYDTQSGWIQIAAMRDAEWAALGRVLGVDVGSTKAAQGDAIETTLAAAFLTKTATQWTRALDDAGVPNEIAFDTKGPEGALYDADVERLGLVVEYRAPDRWATCASSESS